MRKLILPVCILAVALSAEETKWSLTEADEAVQAFSRPGLKGKEVRKQAAAWLERLEAAELKLGEYAYLEAVAQARKGDVSAASSRSKLIGLFR